ncbi:hypothetical protein ACFVVM_11420 [Nocardia sp. NPDC058176]|uniref:hypothetical protein n=1 Tax=Nocardia sp. NPDC058176 TaxID=3346368 RepID=UPI0036D994F6
MTEPAEIDRVSARLAEIRGKASTPDAGVVVETDISGRITDLHLSDRAMTWGPHRLARSIADRHRAAMTQVYTEAEQVFSMLDADR